MSYCGHLSSLNLSAYVYKLHCVQILSSHKHNHRKLTNLITWTTALSNSVKTKPYRVGPTQDGQIMVESSDKMWSTGEGNGKPLQYSCLENPMKNMKRPKKNTERLTPLVGRCPIYYWRSVEK